MGNSIFEVIVSNIVNHKEEVLAGHLQTLEEIKTKIKNGQKIQNRDVERARLARQLIYEWMQDYGTAIGLEWHKIYDLYNVATKVFNLSDEIITAYHEKGF